MQNFLRRTLNQDASFNWVGVLGTIFCVGGFYFLFCLGDTLVSIFEDKTLGEYIVLFLLIALNYFISMINIYYRMKYPLSIALGLSFISSILIASSVYLTIAFITLTGVSIIIKRFYNANKKK